MFLLCLQVKTPLPQSTRRKAAKFAKKSQSSNSLGLDLYEAACADLRATRWNPHRPAEVDGIPLPGGRAFPRNLRRIDRRDLCRSRYLARPQADGTPSTERS